MRYNLTNRLRAIRRLLAGPRRRQGDRGATTAILATLLGGGVLLGMGAIVIDVGQAYVERTELQRAADAAAIAMAKHCALGLTPCSEAELQGLAETYANENSQDGYSEVTEICGRGDSLDACPQQPTNLTGCLSEPPDTGDYIEVRTSTLTKDGTTVLPPKLSRLLTGRGGDVGFITELGGWPQWMADVDWSLFGQNRRQDFAVGEFVEGLGDDFQR